MKELYLMAVTIKAKGAAKDLKQLDRLTGALVNYLRTSLSPEELEKVSRMDLEVHAKSIKEFENLVVL